MGPTQLTSVALPRLHSWAIYGRNRQAKSKNGYTCLPSRRRRYIVVQYLVAWLDPRLLLPIRCLALTWTISRGPRASPLLTRSGQDCILPSPHSTTRPWPSIEQTFERLARYITPHVFRVRPAMLIKTPGHPHENHPSCLSVISCAVLTDLLTQTHSHTTVVVSTV